MPTKETLTPLRPSETRSVALNPCRMTIAVLEPGESVSGVPFGADRPAIKAPVATAPVATAPEATMAEPINLRRLSLDIESTSWNPYSMPDRPRMSRRMMTGRKILETMINNNKPHPEGLEAAMNILSAPRESVAHVGDAPEDIEMGKSPGVMTVGGWSSYPSSKRLPDSEPDLYLDSIGDMQLYF